jgi:hypothetical protein
MAQGRRAAHRRNPLPHVRTFAQVGGFPQRWKTWTLAPLHQVRMVGPGAVLSWLRIDDGFASNPKIAALSDRELRIWLRTLCYCAKVKDPTVDSVVLKEVSGLTPKTVGRFAELHLLDVSGHEHEVHDWLKYLPKDSTNAERQANWRARRNASSNGIVTVEVTVPVTEIVTDDVPF